MPEASLVIFVSSGNANLQRRNALRKSWFKYLTEEWSSLIAPKVDVRVEVVFLLPIPTADVLQEMEQFNDIVCVNITDGYENLWRRALMFLQMLESETTSDPFQSRSGPLSLSHYDYVMHADDDSFVRLDLLLPLLAASPRERFYWGYVWDGKGNRATRPIRDTKYKSHMPESQYPLDYYPPFASGCGFVLSRDLVKELVKQPLPDYRLLDPPFGIHLCGQDMCILHEPIVPVHDERVRPYRGLPIFHPETIVQHYMKPEEMKPFYEQALVCARGGKPDTSQSAADLYKTLVDMGVFRR